MKLFVKPSFFSESKWSIHRSSYT